MTATRRLTAILAADVAGYSQLMGQDEEGTHERLRAHLREWIEPKIAEHRGRVVKNTGDGFLAEFPSVVDGTRCAVEIQRGMAERNGATDPDERIEFRIGINLGDVIAEDEDIFGDGVNVAARLEALAGPGRICVSRVVRDQVRDRLDYTFEDLGEQSVKNIARPVRAYRVRDRRLLGMSGIRIEHQSPAYDVRCRGMLMCKIRQGITRHPQGVRVSLARLHRAPREAYGLGNFGIRNST
jgi:class 3 adenylate cyclase